VRGVSAIGREAAWLDPVLTDALQAIELARQNSITNLYCIPLALSRHARSICGSAQSIVCALK
jgi:hypothetical protein